MEQSEIYITDEVLLQSGDIEDCSVIEKLLIDRKIIKKVIRSTLINIWRAVSKCQFKEIGPIMFIITFSCYEEYVRILC